MSKTAPTKLYAPYLLWQSWVLILAMVTMNLFVWVLSQHVVEQGTRTESADESVHACNLALFFHAVRGWLQQSINDSHWSGMSPPPRWYLCRNIIDVRFWSFPKENDIHQYWSKALLRFSLPSFSKADLLVSSYWICNRLPSPALLSFLTMTHFNLSCL